MNSLSYMMQIHFERSAIANDVYRPLNLEAKSIWAIMGLSESDYSQLNNDLIASINNLGYAVLARNEGESISKAKLL